MEAPTRWALWSQPRPEVVHVLTWELLAVVAVVAGIVLGRVPGGQDWARFGVLLGCASAHVFLSRRQEETRRTRSVTLHVELTSIWTFPAALVLPVPLAVLLILVIRAQRWFVARRPVYRYVFSSLVICGAAVAVHELLTATGAATWSVAGWAGSLRMLGLLLVAGLVYSGVQLLLVGTAVALHTGRATVPNVLGTTYDNALEALTVVLGVVTALLLVNVPVLVVLMVPLGVAGNYIAEVRQLHLDVRTDTKTDLLNMRGWRAAAERDLHRSTAAGTPSALLMLDLDYFKTINDTWGHPAGDDVLRSVAAVLRNETRPNDLLGRFGGEEFVVLLPGVPGTAAITVADRIRRRVGELRVATTDKRGSPTEISGRTASIGVAAHPADAASLDGLLQAADAAVYEAKDAGRDRVRMARSGRSSDVRDTG